MSAFLIDPNTGERVRIGGKSQRVTGALELVQGMRVSWRTVRGECLLDPTRGLPVFDLGDKGTPHQRVEQLVAEEAGKVPGVVSIDVGETSLDTATRVLSIPFTGEGSLVDQDRRVRLEGTTDVAIG